MDTYFVAIVEDDASEASNLISYFHQYEKEANVVFEIRPFPSGEAFLSSYQPVYDLVLMDIGLPGLNGMETAIRFREMDTKATLIFVTNMTQYAVHGYEVDAADYVLKPVSYPRFAIKLKRAMRKLEDKRDSEVVLNLPEGLYRLPASQIYYIEISSHDLCYHTTTGDYQTYGSLKQVEKNLNSRQFVRCNSCYLVNLAYVRGIRENQVQVGNILLQMSRPKKKEFLQALNDYLGGGIS